jgi:hypothetical protein
MSAEKVRSHRLREQPVEGDRDVIDRELARKKEGQKEAPAAGKSRKRSKINPDATPGTGMPACRRRRRSQYGSDGLTAPEPLSRHDQKPS